MTELSKRRFDEAVECVKCGGEIVKKIVGDEVFLKCKSCSYVKW